MFTARPLFFSVSQRLTKLVHQYAIACKHLLEAVTLVVDRDLDRAVVVAIGDAGDATVTTPGAGVGIEPIRKPDLLAAREQEYLRRHRATRENTAGARTPKRQPPRERRRLMLAQPKIAEAVG